MGDYIYKVEVVCSKIDSWEEQEGKYRGGTTRKKGEGCNSILIKTYSNK